MKIILENLVAKIGGRNEDEIPVNSSIRFVLDKYSITVKIDKNTGGLSVYKSHGIDDTLTVKPNANNKIIIL